MPAVKGMQFPIDVILVCIRLYASVSIKLSARGKDDGVGWCIDDLA